MIEIPKLLVIILIGFVAWYVMRRLNAPPRRDVRRRPAPQRPAPRAVEAEDLAVCAVCKAYVAAGARSCGRPNCPRPR